LDDGRALSEHEFSETDVARYWDGNASIAQMAQEQREVRIWGGIHFRNSLVVGDEMGRKIAAFLAANAMKPAK
jgi:hypothetical protein